MRSGASALRLAAALSGVALLGAPEAAAQSDRAACSAAVLEAASGDVRVIAADGASIPAAMGLALCPGDRLETGGAVGRPRPAGPEFSRATLRFDAGGKLLRIGSDTVLTMPAGGPDAGAAVGLERGLIYVIGTVRRFFAVETRYLTAGIDGTEATVQSEPGVGAVVAVRDGAVRVLGRGPRPAGDDGGADGGEVRLAGDGVAFAAPGAAPRAVGPADAATLPPAFRRYVVRADWAVDWSVRYPAPRLLAGAGPAADAAAALIADGRLGDAERTLACAAAPGRQDPAAAACALIAVLLDRQPGEAFPAPAAYAAPTGAAAGAPGPWALAQSYVAQSEGRLGDARVFAEAAVAALPGDEDALARAGELDLLLGDVRSAEARLAPLVPEGAACGAAGAGVQAVLGFARLAAYRFDAALERFDCALAADPSDPLGALGRGLARWRRGQRAEGLADLQTALAADPTRSATRVWLGRALLSEGDAEKAAAQFDLATREDPDDPLPRLFSALERFAANDPIGALRETEAAEARAGRRSTLRSGLGLGEDAAVLGAALGRAHQVLGFDRLALLRGAEAVADDPTNPGAQRFLADALRSDPDYEAAAANAYLKSRLLAPPSKDPVQPRLGEPGLALLDTPGPARPTFAEFSPLLQSAGPRFDVSAAGGTQGTLEGEGSAVWLGDRVSLGIGAFRLRTDGYRDNNDVDHLVAAAELNAALGPDLTLWAELRHRETDAGDRSLEFDLSDLEGTLDTALDTREATLGATWRAGPGVAVFGMVQGRERTERARNTRAGGAAVSLSVDEAQALSLHLAADIAVGAALGRPADTARLGFGVEGALLERERRVSAGRAASVQPLEDEEHLNLFAELSGDLAPGLSASAGLAFERYSLDTDDPGGEVAPWIGAAWEVGPATLRAAWFRETARPEILRPSLAPGLVAGFSRARIAPEFSRRDLLGLGTDLRVGPDTWVGGDLRLELSDDFRGDFRRFVDFGGYVHHLLGDSLALTLEYRETRDRGGREIAAPDRSTLRVAPARLRWFRPDGFFAGLDATLLHYDFEDARPSGAVSGDSFSVLLDASAGWRAPNNAGIVSLELLNILDQDVRVQDPTLRFNDPRAPRFARSFTAMLRFTGSF